MNLSSFKESLSGKEPPPHLSLYLNSMWYDAKGNWNKAHEIVQDVDDDTASWIHAYLHRKEGDNANAGYWYNRAGKRKSAISLHEEGEEMVTALL